jgi:hypothetical protein
MGEMLNITLTILAVAGTLPVMAAEPSAVIDLSLEPWGGWGSVGPGDAYLGQNYDVGVTGNLVAAEIYVRNDGELANLTMSLTETRNNVPSIDPMDILVSARAQVPPRVAAPSESEFQWILFEFPPTGVLAGQQLAFVFGSDQNHNPSWHAAAENGETWAWVSRPDFERWGHPMNNFAFRTHVVPIPEPEGSILFYYLTAILAFSYRLRPLIYR